MLQLQKFLCIKTLFNALVAESVDAADLKSVEGNLVRVQVSPSAPIRKASLLGGFSNWIVRDWLELAKVPVHPKLQAGGSMPADKIRKLQGGEAKQS